MREIKFRAVWRRKNYIFNVAVINFQEDTIIGEDTHQIYLLSDCDLLQYTGLKDKNGKEIFEGDIVVSKDNGAIYTVEFLKNGMGVSRDENPYQGAGWYLVKDGWPSVFSRFWNLEIIGNIYENKELLK